MGGPQGMGGHREGHEGDQSHRTMDLEDEDEYRPSVLAFAHMVMSSQRERKKKKSDQMK